jgi:hypothetical protein
MESKGNLIHVSLLEWLKKKNSETDMRNLKIIQEADGHQLFNIWKQLQKPVTWQPLNDHKIYG